MLKLVSLVKMLSINVKVSLVTRVIGLSISGYKLIEYIISKNDFVPWWDACLNKSMLKSPQTKIVFCIDKSITDSSRCSRKATIL